MATGKLLHQELTSNNRVTNSGVSPFPYHLKSVLKKKNNLLLKSFMTEHTPVLHIIQTHTFKMKELSLITYFRSERVSSSSLKS